MYKKRIIILLIFIIIIIVSALRLDGYAKKSFDEKYANLAYSSALLDIVGELRYTAAAILWVKIDIYHHEHEFRGKEIMRNAEILPLFRMVTLLDPHFIQAYDTGAFNLVVDLKKVDEGLAFLREGIRNNPDSFELNWEYGFLMYYEKKYEEALPYLLKAYENRDKTVTNIYDDNMKIVWINSRIINCYEELGQPEKANPYQIELDEYTARESLEREDTHDADLEQMKKRRGHSHSHGGHVHDENCDHSHEGHVHDENCGHNH